MARVRRLVSSLLLAGGIVLVFAGLSAAFGFTLSGMVASIGVIATLLYAGGTWFGEATPAAPHGEPISVFDAHLALPSGAPLLARFPEPLRGEIRACCLTALAGTPIRVVAGQRIFDASPIRDGEGIVLYGALIERTAASTNTPAPALQASALLR